MQPLHSTATRMQPTLHRLADVADLPPDWDSYGAHAPAARALSLAYRLLFDLEDRADQALVERLQPYAVAPLANGGVQIHWRGRGAEIEVDIDPLGRLGYLLLQGEGATRTFTEADDVTPSDLLSRILEVIASRG